MDSPKSGYPTIRQSSDHLSLIANLTFCADLVIRAQNIPNQRGRLLLIPIKPRFDPGSHWDSMAGLIFVFTCDLHFWSQHWSVHQTWGYIGPAHTYM
jgi:hypothetical protein